MNVELLTEHHLEFLSLKGSCTGLSESALVKMPHCLKSHDAAQLLSLTKGMATPQSSPPNLQLICSAIFCVTLLILSGFEIVLLIITCQNIKNIFLFDLILDVPSTIFQLCRAGSVFLV